MALDASQLVSHLKTQKPNLTCTIGRKWIHCELMVKVLSFKFKVDVLTGELVSGKTRISLLEKSIDECFAQLKWDTDTSRLLGIP